MGPYSTYRVTWGGALSDTVARACLGCQSLLWLSCGERLGGAGVKTGAVSGGFAAIDGGEMLVPSARSACGGVKGPRGGEFGREKQG